MKTYKILVMVIFTTITFHASNAQSNKDERSTGVKTELIKVYGMCGMDKRRIEKNAYLVDGVKSAVWNEDTQILTLKYNVSKSNTADNVQKKIASAGNDTERYRADDAVYESLPECCHYQRKKS